MKKQDTYSAVILAAGNSSRMNASKPFLLFDGENSFAVHIINTYLLAGINEIIVVVNEKNEKDIRLLISGINIKRPVRIVVNKQPERGRFYSVQCGLEIVNSDYNFIQNIDCPFISKELLQQMIEKAGNHTYVVPAFKGKAGHPVIINKDIRNYLLSLPGDDTNLRNELKRFKKIDLNWEDQKILANINTPAEYEKYFLPEEQLQH